MSLKNLEKVAVFITPRKKILTAIRYRLHIISIAEKWPAIAVTRKIAFHIKNGMCAHCWFSRKRLFSLTSTKLLHWSNFQILISNGFLIQNFLLWHLFAIFLCPKCNEKKREVYAHEASIKNNSWKQLLVPRLTVEKYYKIGSRWKNCVKSTL